MDASVISVCVLASAVYIWRYPIHDNIGGHKRWQPLEPQASPFCVRMPKHIRLDYLIIRRQTYQLHWGRVFNANFVAVCIIKRHEKTFCFHRLFVAVFLDFSFCPHPYSAGICHISTGRKCQDHIPFHFQQFQRIHLQVPFGMPAGTWLNVAGVGFVCKASQLFCDRL